MATSGASDSVDQTNEKLSEQELKALLEEIDQQKFDYVRFSFADIHGISRCKSVPRRHVNHFITAGGITLFAGAVGFGPRSQLVEFDSGCCNSGNVVVRPMIPNVTCIPWAADGQFSVGQLLCETYWPPHYLHGAPHAASPRYAARRQLTRLRQLGYRLKSGFEAEFTVFRTPDVATPLFDGGSVFAGQQLAEVERLLYDLESRLAASGIDVLTVQTEYGPGQMELALAPDVDIVAADAMFRLREAVKEICSSRGLFATFMAKPTATAGSSGLHFNHSLWSPDADRDEFYAESGLSEVGRRWLAGLVKHGPALTAVCAPTVNCYRRLHKRPVPTRADWGVDDRTRAFRLQCSAPGATFIENRIASGPANPYLVMAATTAAGIDGLEAGCAVNDSDKEAPMLPKTLEEALDALLKDKVMVDALGVELVEWFVRIKSEVEIARTNDTDLSDAAAFAVERELYFKFL